ncbi:MAG TPA: diacylglycerol kinase family protein [Phycisphaerae bacterium]|nr:diacylglycerol kinase family protein [Phycisphaerae bacterium]
MRVVAIINPISGAGCRDRLGELFRAMAAAGWRVDRWVTRRAGQAGPWARRAAAGRADAALAVGGDGTVCEIAGGLAGTDCPMLIWPVGTENLVAKSLGFRADPEHTLATVRAGNRSVIDLGTANGRSFVVVAGVGFDAEVVERLTRLRVGHITHLTYAGPLWRTFWEHRWPDLEVTADTPEGPRAWRGRGMVFVGNMSRYSLGLQVVRDAVPDDGLLDVVAMGCRNHLQLIGHSLRTLARRHIKHPDVWHARVTRVRIAAQRKVPVEIDGEFAGHLPLDIAVQPRALHLLIPAT